MAYDESNIFAKILRGEMPCNLIYEDDHNIAFHDINPQAPTHVLVLPKGKYTSYTDFAENASDEEIVSFTKAVAKVAREVKIVDPGYRILSNDGPDSHQEVPHLHIHLLAGKPLGPMVITDFSA